MILVDTSVWIDHIRSSEPYLMELLEAESVLCHPLVVEEVACGHLKDRDEIVRHLHSLPQAPIATHREILRLIAAKKFYGVGLGAIDVHLIASAMLASAKIWSRDNALTREAKRLSVNSD